MTMPPMAGAATVSTPSPPKCSASARPKRFGLRRVLEDERALQVLRAVQPARQNEVAFEQRARPPEPLDDFLRLHPESFPFPRGACYNAGPMLSFRNLVPDSRRLVEETIRLLRT